MAIISNNTFATQPNQRASVKEKQTARWYIQNAEYIIGLATGLSNKAKTKEFLAAANSETLDREYDHIMINYKDAPLTKNDMLGKIRSVDLITPIKEKYMGEFINMFDNYQVFNNDPNITLARNSAIRNKVVSIVNRAIVEQLNKQGGNQGDIANIDVDKLVKAEIDNWSDDVIIEAQHHLNLLNTVIDAKAKYIQAYFYWFSCEEVYSYRNVVNDDIQFEIISPLEYYRVDSGARYIEDDTAGVRHYKLHINDAIVKFREHLNKSEIKYLQCTYGTESKDGSSPITVSELPDYSDRECIFGTGYHRPEFNTTRDMIDIYHYVWKTEIKIGMLKYIGADGFENEKVVDANYKLDTSAGDISIEWDYQFEVWEGYRLGSSYMGVYTKPRPTVVQRNEFNNESECKLPYNGMVGMLFDNARNPVPYRLLDYQILYRLYTLQQERAANRYKSWLLFPESLLTDSGEFRPEERLRLADRDSFLPFDDTQATANSLQSIREVANTSLINYINVLENIKQNIKQEAFDIANMNDARFGNINQSAGKGVTEYAYNQAVTGSVLLLETFNTFREKDYISNLDWSKIAWFNGKQGTYINPNTGALETVSLSGRDSLCDNIGVYMKNNAEVERMLSELKNLAFNISQNGNADVAIEAITNTNIMDLKSKIKDSLEREKLLEQQMQQYEQQLKQSEIQAKMEQDQLNHERAIELERIKSDTSIQIANINADSKLRSESIKSEIDVNNNGYIDESEKRVLL